MNKAILMGRLTRDPDIRHTQGENSITIARFTVAVDRRFRKNGAEQQADFINCVAFRQQAEFMERYMRKGTKVCLSGSIQTGSYTNRDGVKVYTTEVAVDEIEFAESKKASESYGGQEYGGGASQSYGDRDYGSQSYGGQNYGGQNYGGQNYGGSSAAPQPADDGFMNVPDGIDDELPFT